MDIFGFLNVINVDIKNKPHACLMLNFIYNIRLIHYL